MGWQNYGQDAVEISLNITGLVGNRAVGVCPCYTSDRYFQYESIYINANHSVNSDNKIH